MNEVTSNENIQESQNNNKHSESNIVRVWGFVLLIYVVLLAAIGWVAFWDQDFNKTENTVAPYIKLLADYKDKFGSLTEEELGQVIQSMMVKDADGAGDLQELASQSFNIVLGALLAFLSASATMVFQNLSNSRHGRNNRTSEASVEGSS